MNGFIVEASNLTRLFGKTVALDNVDISIIPGCVHGLVGVNGAGKTTFINHVLGLLKVILPRKSGHDDLRVHCLQEGKRLYERSQTHYSGIPRGSGSLGDAMMEFIYIVQPQTFYRWNRLMEKGKIGKSPNKRGRRKICLECKTLIKRFASENVNWGYTRIMAELKNLGSKVGRTSVKRILQEESVSPTPDRAGKQWNEFIERHMDSLWETEFSSIIVQIDNNTVIPFPIQSKGDVRYKQRLGGLLKSYYRNAV